MFPIALAHQLGWTCLALTFIVAVWRGGLPEKLGASLSVAAWVASTLVEQRHNWLEPQYGIFAVDIVVLLGLTALAFWSRRYWSVWAAGFQAVGVLTHLLFLINPAALYRAYYMSNFSIAFLVLGAIVAGTIFERPKPPVVSRR